MTAAIHEPWLRGPIPGIPDLLQPAAHALVGAQEEISAVLSNLAVDHLWARVGDSASIGFHVVHLAGSTDRLLTYARAEPLSDAQRVALQRERSADTIRPSLDEIRGEWDAVVHAALDQFRSTPADILAEPRFVGRARLHSTVVGLLFHAAEHAARHAGQIVTTAKILLFGNHGR